jgi:tetratricopeptide (TPR) repeat protein
VNEIGLNTYSVHEIIRDYSLSDVSKRKILKSYHERAAEYYLSLDDNLEHVLEASYQFNKAGKKEESAEVIINNAGDLIAKGFWEKIEDRLQSAIKSFRRKTQPQAIQLAALAHLKIGELYRVKGDYDLALYHATKSLISFKKIQDISDIFSSYNLLAGIYHYKRENEKAKEYNEKCLKIAEKQKNDIWKAVAMENRGSLLLAEDINKSLDYYMKSLEMFENENAEINIADACTNIANVYEDMGNYEKSYEYIKRALELYKERKAVYNIAITKKIMANIYYKDQKKPVSVDSIIKCLNEALETYEKIGHVRGTASILGKIGDIYLDEGDFKSAVATYQQAATIYSSLNQQSEEAELNAKIGLCYAELKDFTNAKSYFEKNLLSGHCSIEDKLSLAEIYLIMGAYNEAFDLSNKLITDDTEESSDDKRYLALLFLSVSSVLSNKVDDAYNYLKKIGGGTFQLLNPF